MLSNVCVFLFCLESKNDPIWRPAYANGFCHKNQFRFAKHSVHVPLLFDRRPATTCSAGCPPPMEQVADVDVAFCEITKHLHVKWPIRKM